MFWLFGDSKERVTRTEFEESVIPRLRDRGLSMMTSVSSAPSLTKR